MLTQTRAFRRVGVFDFSLANLLKNGLGLVSAICFLYFAFYLGKRGQLEQAIREKRDANLDTAIQTDLDELTGGDQPRVRGGRLRERVQEVLRDQAESLLNPLRWKAYFFLVLGVLSFIFSIIIKHP